MNHRAGTTILMIEWMTDRLPGSQPFVLRVERHLLLVEHLQPPRPLLVERLQLVNHRAGTTILMIEWMTDRLPGSQPFVLRVERHLLLVEHLQLPRPLLVERLQLHPHHQLDYRRVEPPWEPRPSAGRCPSR